MKRYLAVLAASCMSAMGLAAQDNSLLDRLYDNVSSSCVEISYKYSVETSGIRTVGNGILQAQDSLWHMTGNGIEIWCDDSTVWITDPLLKEAVIEPASSATQDYMSNPALLFINMKDVFAVRSSRETPDAQAVLYILVPKIRCGIGFCNIELLKSDASIRNATFVMEDGNDLDIVVSSMKLTPKRSASSFRPPLDFDSSWIVTDMRP